MQLEIIARVHISNATYAMFIDDYDFGERQTDEGILLDRGTLGDILEDLNSEEQDTEDEIWEYYNLKSTYEKMLDLNILLVLFVN